VNHSETYEAVIFPLDGVVDVTDVITADHDERDFLTTAHEDAGFDPGEVKLANKSFWSGVESDLVSHLVANRPLQVWKNPSLGLYSRVGETEEEFRGRCASAQEDAADAELAKLRDKYQTRIDRLRDQIATAQARFAEADAVASAKSQETLLGTAGDLLGAFLGGRSGSTALSKAAQRRTASAKAAAKAETEQAKYEAKMVELAELEDELATAIEETTARFAGLADQTETVDVPLEKTDVRVAQLKLVWVPTAS
jgi:hypothetical protein